MNQSAFTIRLMVTPESLINKAIRPYLFALSRPLMVFPLAYIDRSILELLTYKLNVRKAAEKRILHYHDLPNKYMDLISSMSSKPFHC